MKATGTNGVALFEDIQDPASDGTVSAVNSLTISGGKFEGAGQALLLNDVETANVDITAGTFNTDITQLRDGAFTENLNISKDADGNYVISLPEPEPSTPQHSGGGGCSAGFGALALLAAVPLLRMRKK